MRLRYGITAFLCLTFCLLCRAQRTTALAWQITEENDFLNITQRGIDRYYTQGFRITYQYTATKRKHFERLLIPISSTAQNRYSFSASQEIYTPRQTYSLFFVGDRPYAGCLFGTFAMDSYDSARKLRLLTKLDMGVIGPIALAEPIQDFFHFVIKNDPAVGWATQLRNDVLLNYSAQIEKQFVAWRAFTVTGHGGVAIGTRQISASVGTLFNIGIQWAKKNFSASFFFKPQINAMAYNALLQGGALNRLYADAFYSQYFLGEIKTLTYSHSTGFSLRKGGWELQYSQTNITREFTGQLPHYYGRVSIIRWMRNQ